MRIGLLHLLVLSTFCISCAALKDLVKSKAGTKKAASQTAVARQPANTFNSNPNFKISNIPRQYRRMTTKQFEEEARIKPNEGSLWIMEGQESYLFTQNQKRLLGDVVNVALDGQARSELEIKTKSIEDLLNKKEEQLQALKSKRTRGPADAGGATPAPGAAPAGAQNQAPGAAPNPATPAPVAKKTSSPFQVDTVQTRIIEQLNDGSYRVKGSRSFMIGKKEFRVLVTGIAKSSDISGDKVASTKLLNPKFDIVRTGGSL